METIDNNQELYNRMAKYLNDEMDGEERMVYENEIKTDITLKTMIDELKNEWEMIEQLGDPADVNVDKAWNNLNLRIHESKASKTYSLRFAMRIAAGFILIIGLAIGGYSILNNGNSSVVVASGNSKKEVVLPDGSIALLNIDSRIEYPKAFDKDLRSVILDGEAYFDVVSNPEVPFIIQANEASVKVLGTSFNVYARKAGFTEVFLEKGKVQLMQKDKVENKIVLEPGDIGALKSGAMTKFKNEDANYMSWKTDSLEFRGDPLSYVLSTLSHAYNTNFDVINEEINEMHYTATITNQSLENVVEALETSFENMKFTYSNGIYTVLTK